MAVIATTREMGTLGKDVVAGLAERLGLGVIHHGIVEHDIAENAGLPENEVHRFLEGEASLLERWRMDRRRMRCCTEREIFELAAKGNVLIRGWGSVYLLRSVPHVVSVRVCARGCGGRPISRSRCIRGHAAISIQKQALRAPELEWLADTVA